MTPLERAARALARQDVIDRLGREPSERDVDLLWRGSVEKARATLLAVREPSEVMSNEGWDAACSMVGDYGFAIGGETPVWQAMLDALLDEGADK